MSLLAALALLGTAAQAPQPQASGFTLFGQLVSATAPAPGAAGPPETVQSWAGWGPLKGPAAPAFDSDADWSSILAMPGAIRPDASAAPWRVKVFLLPSVDLLSPDASGNAVERRTGIYGPTRATIAAGLALAGAALQAQAAGKLAVQFDTTEDPALYEETVAEGEGLGAKALADYVGPRINGGHFESNDKVYYGPYNVCLVIHAGLSKGAETVASDTPVVGIPAPAEASSASELAATVLDAFRGAAEYWSRRHGRVPAEGQGPAAGAAFGDQTPTQIADDAGLGPVAGSALADALKAGPYHAKPFVGFPLPARSAVSPNAQVTLVQDPDKGSVLDLQLSGTFNDGGVSLPLPASPADLAKRAAHVLTFDVKTAAASTLGLGLVDGAGKRGDGVALGARLTSGPAIAVPNGGKWHSVAVDLSRLSGIDGASGLFIGFLRSAAAYPKDSIEVTEAAFANFGLADAAPPGALTVADSAGPDWAARAAAARAAVSAASPDVTAVTQALADANDMVRLNALRALAAKPVPGLEDKIVACTKTVDPLIAEAAVQALAAENSPVGWVDLQQILAVGPGTHTKVAAAVAIGPRKDSSSGPISALQGSARDWHDRLALAQALAANGTPQAIIFLRAFLDDPDPVVRAGTVSLTPIDDDPAAHRLMFLAVNDSSDAVRAAASIKLLQSQTPEIKLGGYRGANDDSWFVRVTVLDWIAAHPSADDRPALRQAVTSPFGPVRAAALRALATAIAPVSLDEIADVLKDPDPAVQSALVALAVAKKLALPAESVALLRASVDPAVASAAKSLPGS